MEFFDSHSHYNDEKYDLDRDQIIDTIYKEGITRTVCVGYNVDQSKQAIEIAEKYHNMYATCGISPNDIEDFVDNNLNIIEKIAKNDKVVAIGEIGLDYHYTKEFKEEQKRLFKEQLEFAYEIELPVQIHSRDASIDTVEVLESTDKKPEKIMFHCFDLNEQTAKYIKEKGYKISVGGNITYKRTDTAIKVIKEMPIENIMTETDCPYLAPVPHRGERNESLNIAYVIEKIAEIKEMDVEEVAKIVYNNAIEFYGLGENS